MAHDANKVLMAVVRTSAKDISEHIGSPATFLAGLAVRKKSDDTLSLSKADGQWLGISLGKGMSDSTKTVAIARDGYKVPVLLSATPARLVVTITNYSNLVATSNDTLRIQHAGASIDQTLTFKASPTTEDEVAAATGNNATASSLASKINAHSVLSLHFYATVSNEVVTITALDDTLNGADFTVTYASNTSVGLTLDASTFTGGGTTAPDYVAIGSKVYFSDDTGKADDPNSGATISDAIYVSGVLTGIQEDGTEVSCALVDMGGGL